MQRGPELDAAPDYLAFLKRNHWRDDLDSGFGSCTGADQFLERVVILRPAVRIPGAVFRDRANVNRLRAYGFRPTYGHGKKMRIAKWHVGYGYISVRRWND